MASAVTRSPGVEAAEAEQAGRARGGARAALACKTSTESALVRQEPCERAVRSGSAHYVCATVTAVLYIWWMLWNSKTYEKC